MRPLTPNDPREIGGYRLLERVGAGGMGVVYLAEPPGGGEPCALKLIRPEHADDADFRARFDREVTLARRVTGPFTARVLGADTTGEAPWLATEYVRGSELGRVVREQGPLDGDTLRALAAGLVEALQAIHGVGLVHRDLKPSNVLVTGDGPRVIDFGIARAVDGTALTVTGQALGTPGYMAPELVRGAEPAPEADVFALGGVLAFAATGRQPFGAGEAVAVLFRAVTDEPDLEGVPLTLRSLVMRCLAKEPGSRPSLTELHSAFVRRGGRARDEIPQRGWLPGAVAAELDRLAPLPSPGRSDEPEEPAESDTATARWGTPTGTPGQPRSAATTEPESGAPAAPADPSGAGQPVPAVNDSPEPVAEAPTGEQQRRLLWVPVLSGAVSVLVFGAFASWQLVDLGALLRSDASDPAVAAVTDGETHLSEDGLYWGRSKEDWTRHCPEDGPRQVYAIEVFEEEGSAVVLSDYGTSLFDLGTGREVDRLIPEACEREQPLHPPLLAASRDRATLAVTDRDLVRVSTAGDWGLDLTASHAQVVGTQQGVLSLSGDGSVIAGVRTDDSLWIQHTHRTGVPVPLETGRILDVALDASGGFAALQDTDGNVDLWDLEHREHELTLGAVPVGPRAEAANSLLFGPDGEVVHGAGGTVTVWDGAGEVRHELSPSVAGDIRDLWLQDTSGQGTPETTLGAVVGDESAATVVTWDLAGGELVREGPEGILAGPVARSLEDGSLIGVVYADPDDPERGVVPALIRDGARPEPFEWLWD